jgi:hypothetical protein
MKNIERNDVDISVLFSYKKEMEVEAPTGEKIPLYIKLVGDAELNIARVFALRESREFRENLEDVQWKDRKAFIPSIKKLKKEDLINIILSFKLKDFQEAAYRTITVPEPKKPSGDADLEEHENYQKEIDEYPEKVTRAASKKALDESEIERKRLEKKLKKDLAFEYENYIIGQLCNALFFSKFKEKCAYFGTFKSSDYKVRAFNSFEDFENVPTSLKGEILNVYLELEMEMEDLKKLPEATP